MRHASTRRWMPSHRRMQPHPVAAWTRARSSQARAAPSRARRRARPSRLAQRATHVRPPRWAIAVVAMTKPSADHVALRSLHAPMRAFRSVTWANAMRRAAVSGTALRVSSAGRARAVTSVTTNASRAALGSPETCAAAPLIAPPLHAWRVAAAMLAPQMRAAAQGHASRISSRPISASSQPCAWAARARARPTY